MSNAALAPRSSALAVPTRNELEALGPGDRWTLEERADEIKDLCRELNDAELRHWVEVEGVTLTEVAKRVGRSVSRISRRCARLQIEPDRSKGGRPKVLPPQNPDDEVIDAEVVEDDPQPRPPSQSSPAAAASPELEGAPDPGPRVKCPTCGHMVVPSDIQTWKE